MRTLLVSDRVRTSPKTGAVIPRDRATNEEGRAVESEFGAERPIRVPRGGVASFQIVVSSEQEGDGADISVQVHPMSGGGGGPEQADVLYQWPCQLSEDEWTFEGLVPVDVYRSASAAVRRGPLGPREHHAYWIDVPVPRDARPGTHRLQVDVRGAAPTLVDIEVLPIDLPLAPRMTVSLMTYGRTILENHPGLSEQEFTACERSYFREVHDHRAVLHHVPYGHQGRVAPGYAPPLEGRGRRLRIADWEAFDRRFGPLFDGSAMAGSPGGERAIPRWILPFNYHWPADFAYFGGPGYEHEWAQILAEFRRHIQEKGWTGTAFEFFLNHKKRYRCFPWDGDEAKHAMDREHFIFYRSLMDRAAHMAGEGGSAARVLFRTDSSWRFGHDAVDPQLGPMFDCWVIHQCNFAWTRYAVEALRARRQEAWCALHSDWYTGHRAWSEEPLLAWDRQLLLCWRRGGDGFLPDWIGVASDPALDRADFSTTPGLGQRYGWMLYPGSRFGRDRALGSVRLRRLRQAIEMIDLLEMLGDGGRALLDELAKAGEEDWWTPTPEWASYPPDVIEGKLYGEQELADPLAHRDPHTPAVIRERAIDLLTGK